MNTFWLKIAGAMIVIFGVVILVSKFPGRESEPKPEPKDFYDVIQEDDRRLRAEPKYEDVERTQEPVAVEPEPKPVVTEPESKPVAVEPEDRPVPKFKELSETERIEAERLFEFAIQQRKIGRLPVTDFRPMVDICRDIIGKFPGSEFDYKARRMLADIPRRYRERYRITEQEIDLTRFFK